MIDFIDCWNYHFYRWHYQGFQKEKLGGNRHFMTALEDFQAKCKDGKLMQMEKKEFILRCFVFCVKYSYQN